MAAIPTVIVRGDGPSVPVNAKPGVGFTSTRPLHYDFTESARTRVVAVLDDTGIEGRVVGPRDAFSYVLHPVFDASEPDVRDAYAATSVCVDLVFDDGSLLSTSRVVDQHGVPPTPVTQYQSQTISVDQWTRKSFALTEFVGRTITRVEFLAVVPPFLDESDRPRRILGYLDTIRVSPLTPTPSDPIDHVRTTRGTQSSDRFSRGNNAPLVSGGPHPFVFGLPMTDGGNRGWPYSYHEASRVDGDRIRPYLQSFATSHIPSPWMGDRGVFQFFPSPLAHPDPDRDVRALAFSHDDEYDRPHLYRVTLDAGDHGSIEAELTGGTHSVWLRATFPGDVGSIIFDQFDGDGSLSLSDKAITGYVDGPGGLVRVPRMYVYVECSATILGTHDFPDHERAQVLGAVTIEASDGPVTLAVGTSFISVEQARRNLDFDRAGGGFDDVAARARDSWSAALKSLNVEGATADQLTTLYSSLYRVNLYPNAASENVGTDAEPRWRYASPFGDPEVPDGPTQTGRRIIDGQLTVTDGFWDSYRASWPLRTLLAPKETAELLNGFVEHYRTGGWVSRWSAPGPADIMTGTSSDAVFADAAIAGLADDGFDIFDAYDSCLRNATTPSDDPRVGRKGIHRSLFTGYADTQTHEGMSWTVDAAINDAAIAAFSEHLARLYPVHVRHDEFVENARWFGARAANYSLMFDGATGFFRGRESDGAWRRGDFDPRRWGIDYTETNAWGTTFTAPHDGSGLASLHGGQANFEAKLDEFFALPETGREEWRGGYPVIIHEMREGRDTRMGMLALSNQPAHHIPFMYAFASRPASAAHAKTQRVITDAVRRLFLGSEVGQGYPGDEDNGEMSAWYLWASSGLYPLTIGSGQYVLSAPSYPRMSWTLENGRRIDIVAPRAGGPNAYVQAVRINGEPWNEITIDRDRLTDGARIEFDLGPQPSQWAVGSTPPSITRKGQLPVVVADLTTPDAAEANAIGELDAPRAFDDDSATSGVVVGRGEVIGWQFDEPTTVTHYTATVGAAGFVDWDVEVCDAEGDWRSLGSTRAKFTWDRQTRIFAVEGRGVLGVQLRPKSSVHVVQLELLRL